MRILFLIGSISEITSASLIVKSTNQLLDVQLLETSIQLVKVDRSRQFFHTFSIQVKWKCDDSTLALKKADIYMFIKKKQIKKMRTKGVNAFERPVPHVLGCINLTLATKCSHKSKQVQAAK